MYNPNNRNPENKMRFLFWDSIAVCLALGLALVLRFSLQGAGISRIYLFLALCIFFSSYIVNLSTNSHLDIVRRGYLKELIATSKFVLIIFATVIAIFFALKILESYSRLVFLYWINLSIILVYIARLTIKKNMKLSSKINKHNHCLIVSDSLEMSEELADSLKKDGNVIAAIALPQPNNTTYKDFKIIDQGQSIDFTIQNVVDEVFILAEGSGLIKEIIADLYLINIPIHIAISRIYDLPYKQTVSRIGAYNFISGYIKIYNQWDLALKRFFDIVVSIVGLALTAIISIVLAPLIKLSSPGPLIFVQKRVGKNGRIFDFYKFRTMYEDAEERKAELMKDNIMMGLMFKLKDDPRVTPIGRFLRKTSLDELPQFLNVLKGDMSVIGTRPPTTDEYENYSSHHKARLTMKPGITGLWQISGRNKISDFEEIVKLDTQYIHNWSFEYDIKIFFKTILVVIKRIGAV